MNLPLPKPEEVTEFQEFYMKQFGEELSLEDAVTLSTTAIQLFYIKNYALPYLRKKK